MEKPNELMKLAKYLALAGVASRRKAEEYIREGWVSVNGETETNVARRVLAASDAVKYKKKLLVFKNHPVYFLVNKPRGVVSTCVDEKGRKTIVDLLPTNERKARLYPVGRLDMDADGLMVLTNDGDFAHRLMHPKFSHLRCYQIKIRGELNDKLIGKLKEGVRLADGVAKAKEVVIMRKSGVYTWVSMSLSEGRNHLIKRIFEKLRMDVLRIKRVRMGPLSITGIPVGKYRPFFRKELLALQSAKRQAPSA